MLKIGYATNVKQRLPCCRAEALMCYSHVPDCAASAPIRWKPAYTEIFEKKQEAVAIYLAAASLFVRPSCFSDLVMWVLDSCSREWA